MTDHNPTDWQLKGVAVAAYTVAVLGKFNLFSNTKKNAQNKGLPSKTAVVLHNKHAYHFANVVGFIKISTLLFISITGFVVLGGHTRVKNPTANFQNSFQGKATAYGTTNSLYKIIFSYAGFENSFNVANEVRVRIRISSHRALVHCLSFLRFLVESREENSSQWLHCHMYGYSSLHFDSRCLLLCW